MNRKVKYNFVHLLEVLLEMSVVILCFFNEAFCLIFIFAFRDSIGFGVKEVFQIYRAELRNDLVFKIDPV